MLLQRHARLTLYLEVGPAHDGAPGETRFRNAAALARVCMRRRRRRGASLRTSSGVFNVWIDKSRADLALLETDLATGPYPFAGIPWFSTPFGRDAIVTALQTLWLDPTLARGVLAFLALHQAREVSAFSDSAPGKILHEMRKSEMCALGEVPFAKYYGGVDTTPLFVMLAGAYAQRTGDLAFIEALWPSLEAAMGWIDGPGDSNQDGFLDYDRGQATGLANQGWKDSVIRSSTPTGACPRADRVARSAGVRLRRPPGDGRAGRPSRRSRGAGPLARARAAPARSRRGTILDAGRGVLRDCDRRGGRAVPRARVERRPPAVHRLAVRAACRARRPAADVGHVRQRLGPAYRVRSGAALQSDVVPQRVRVAARHGPVRCRHQSLWGSERDHASC